MHESKPNTFGETETHLSKENVSRYREWLKEEAAAEDRSSTFELAEENVLTHFTVGIHGRSCSTKTTEERMDKQATNLVGFPCVCIYIYRICVAEYMPSVQKTYALLS